MFIEEVSIHRRELLTKYKNIIKTQLSTGGRESTKNV